MTDHGYAHYYIAEISNYLFTLLQIRIGKFQIGIEKKIKTAHYCMCAGSSSNSCPPIWIIVGSTSFT